MKGTITVLGSVMDICSALKCDRSVYNGECAGLYRDMFAHALGSRYYVKFEKDTVLTYPNSVVVDAPDGFMDSETYKFVAQQAYDVYQTAMNTKLPVVISTKKSLLVKRFSNARAVDFADVYYTLVKNLFRQLGFVVILSNNERYGEILAEGGYESRLDLADKAMRMLLWSTNT